jgi:hypothetical protein
VNASELYEIVKDVDRAAWPDETRFDAENELWANANGFPTDALAEAAFVGSMVGRFEWINLEKVRGKWQAAYKVGEHRSVTGWWDTQIQALAAACKEARP